MKLTEIITSEEKADAKATAWLRKNVEHAMLNYRTIRKGWIYSRNGQIGYNDAATDIDGVELSLNFKPKSGHAVEFDLPFEDSDKAFSLVFYVGLENYIINDFKNLESSTITAISLYDCTVRTFDGINNLHKLDNISINDKTFEQSPPFPVLRLLKHPTLKHFVIDGAATNKQLKALYEILRKHLKTKDVAECMDALIEAGLKEYAKL